MPQNYFKIGIISRSFLVHSLQSRFFIVGLFELKGCLKIQILTFIFCGLILIKMSSFFSYKNNFLKKKNLSKNIYIKNELSFKLKYGKYKI